MTSVVWLLLSASLALCAAHDDEAALMQADVRAHTKPVDCGGASMTFHAFMDAHGRSYAVGSQEYNMRRALFAERAMAIAKHNCDASKSWTQHTNHLADWTAVELQTLRGYKSEARPAVNSSGVQPGSLMLKKPLPESVDYSHLESMKITRDQGACGSCWAFAAETVMRAHAELAGRKHTKFSVSQLVACTPNPRKCGGSGGCEGATAELGFEYALQAGLMDEKEMRYNPYAAKKACPAEHKRSNDQASLPSLKYGVVNYGGGETHTLAGEGGRLGAKMGMMGWTKLVENKEEPLMRALAQSGPLAISVAAGDGWNYYNSGVMSGDGCDHANVVNHAVTLFGYGEMGGKKFWHIKNSWGDSWGENGNLKLHRLGNGQEESNCGWDMKPEDGSGCVGGPKKVWVCGTCAILFDASLPHFVMES